ncbi:MAG: hypothetical protein ACTSYM_00405 [Candidatus Baldrarchaeia archaeon]
MKKEDIVKRLMYIRNYRCEGCLADTGGCTCLEDKERMIDELIKDIVIEWQLR